MALSSIANDIGADRAFLLSEKGFQSGAIRAAAKSNLDLTSLADLTELVGDRAIGARMAGLRLRLHNASTRLQRIKKQQFDDVYIPPTSQAQGLLLLLSHCLDDAVRGEFPVRYLTSLEAPQWREANSLVDMMEAAEEIVAAAESWTPPA